MKSLTTLELDELLKNNAVTKKYFLGTLFQLVCHR